MQFVLNVIAHGDEFPAGAVAAVETYARSQEHVLEVSTRTLHPARAVDVVFSVDPAHVETLATATKAHVFPAGVDVTLVEDNHEWRRAKLLCVFDMDLTLIYQEVIELIAAYADVEPQVAEITTRAMNGELDFAELLAQRVALLKGIPAGQLWDELKPKLEFTQGVPELCRALKKLGCVMAVCSGGFLPLAQYVQLVLGLDYAFANVLEVDAATNTLAGRTVGEVVDGAKKAELLCRIASERGIDRHRAMAIGDGANDLLMMGEAGFGVAWNAKPKVQQLAPCKLNTKLMVDVLYVLGYTQEEVVALIQ